MNNSTFVIRAALGALSLAATGSLFAQAAEAPKKEEVVQLEAFVATGTRFNDRTVTESPVPIDVIPSGELRQGGYTETAQMIQALVPSFNFPRISVGDGSDHIRPAMLRGLAPDQTLVLVNGKRRHTSSLVNVNGFVGRGSVSIDFNAIPASAIGRIEVLRDGASAQYGSDAIAGVINVILAQDNGWRADFQWGQTSEGDGRVLDFNVAGGFKTEGAGNIFLSAFYRDRENTNRSKPDTRQQYFGNSTTTPGALTTLNGNFGSGFAPTANNGTTVAAAASTGFTLNAAETTINRLNHRQGDGDSEDKGLFVNGDLKVGDGATFYYFGGYTLRDGQAAGFWRRPGDDRTVRAIYPNGFLPLINSDIVDYSLGGGFKGDTGKLSWDFSTVYGNNAFDFVISNSANVTLGAGSKRNFDAGGLGFEQWTTNLDFATALGGGANPLKVAFGLEYRWEGYQITAGEPDSYRDGGVRILDGPNTNGLGAVGAQVFPGFRPSDSVDADRNSYALYVDAEKNFTDNLLVSAAVRFEDYSDFGNETTFKLAGRLAMGENVAFRASASTGFRAPHLAQQWFSSTATNFIGGVPFENKTFPVSDPVARLLGARPLKPETSTNLSFGVTWSHANVAASVDFYQVDIDDRINLSSNFSGGPIGPFLAANGQGQANGGRYFTNAIDTETKGVDVNFRYTWNTADMGKLTATVGLNFNETEATRVSATPSQLTALGVVTPLFDIVEQIRIEEGQPKNSFNVGLNWVFNDFTVFLRNVRYGEVSAAQSDAAGWTAARNAAVNQGFDVRLVNPAPGAAAGNMVPIQTFGAKWLTDLDVTWRFDEKTTVSVGANNLFDVYPDQNIASTGSWLGSDNAGIFPYSGISPFGFNGRFYYGKISYKW